MSSPIDLEVKRAFRQENEVPNSTRTISSSSLLREPCENSAGLDILLPSRSPPLVAATPVDESYQRKSENSEMSSSKSSMPQGMMVSNEYTPRKMQQDTVQVDDYCTENVTNEKSDCDITDNSVRHRRNEKSSKPRAYKSHDPVFTLKSTAFQLGGAVREDHGAKIYCIAWSSDMFYRSHQIKQNDKDDEANKSTPLSSSSDRMDRNIPLSPLSGSHEHPTTSTTANLHKPSIIISQETPHEEISQASFTSVGGKLNSSTAFLRYFATCGGNNLSLYEVDVMSPYVKQSDIRIKANTLRGNNNGGFRIWQAYCDVDTNESFYSCVFGGRSIGSLVGYGPSHLQYNNGDLEPIVINANAVRHEHIGQSYNTALNHVIDRSNSNGPELLFVAGERGIIKVIDTVYRRLHMTLLGHGDAINDMKFSPQDPWLLLSASKDESVRLWNVQNASCIAIFAGHEGHKSSILSVSWHPLGKLFASSSMDTSVKLWSTDTPEITETLTKSRAMDPLARLACSSKSLSRKKTKLFSTVYQQLPLYSTTKMHVDYVDCVQFCGDLLLSKSTGEIISVWKPVMSSSNVPRRSRNEVIPLKDFPLNLCNIWFIRFQMDSNCRMLACGNNVGEIKIFELGSANVSCTLRSPACTALIRMVAFSPDDSSLVAVCDDATVWKWDVFVSRSNSSC